MCNHTGRSRSPSPHVRHNQPVHTQHPFLRPRPRILRRGRLVLSAVCTLALVIFLPACGIFEEAPAPNLRAAPIEPVESRIDAYPGMTLILPVRLNEAMEGGTAQEQDLGVTLDDGTPLISALRWITVRPGTPVNDARPAAVASWLPPPGVWSTHTTPPTDPAMAMTVLAIQLPENAQGHALLLGPRRLTLHWLTPPAGLDSRALAGLTSPVPVSIRQAKSLLDYTKSERLSPVRRWRYRLLMTGLNPAELPPQVPGEPITFADPVLEALAAQTEARWTTAITGLARIDTGLAQELIGRLCAVAQVNPFTVVPVWPTDQSDLDALLAELLNPESGPLTRAAAAENWLRRQDPALSWTIDPAAERDGAIDQTVVWIEVLNRIARPILASSAWLDIAEREVGPRPELVPIGPWAARDMRLTVLPDAIRRERTTVGAEVQSALLSIDAGTFPLRKLIPLDRHFPRPPRMTLGPLLPDVSLIQLLSGSSGGLVDSAWSTTAALYRGVPDDLRDAQSPGRAAWILYVESRRPEGIAGSGQPDAVRIHAGPRSSPAMILRVDETGRIDREDARGQAGFSASARVIREQSRWIAIITLPGDTIEEGQLLRLGLERTDARGVHSAWPVASLPWQESPGRAVFELSSWDR